MGWGVVAGRGRRWLALLAALALVLSACGGDGSDESDAGGSDGSGEDGAGGEPFEVTVAYPNELLSLDPLKNQDNPGRLVYGNVYEPLVRRAADGSGFEPLLAAELPTAVDPTTWEVTLDPEARFAGGKDLEAEDVVYTIERVLDPELESEQAPLYSSIADVQAVDESTVRITTETPDPVMMARLSLLLIMPAGGAEASGFPADPASLDGTGAYRLVSHERDVETVMERRDDYWGDASGAPDRVVKRVVSETATSVSGLQAGEIDVVPRLDPDQVEQVPALGSVVGTESVLLRINSLTGPLQDQGLREAVNIAIDREAITESLFGGYATPSECQLPSPNTFGHTDSLSTPEHDPERASQLVSEAGGASLRFVVPAGSFPKFREVGQTITQQLEAVGFDVELEFPEDQEALRTALTDKSQLSDLFLFSTNSEFLDLSQQSSWLVSDGPFSGLDDARIDELAQQAQTTTDEDERLELYRQLNERDCEIVGNAYLYYPHDLYGLSESIDWTPRVDGLIVLTEMKEQ